MSANGISHLPLKKDRQLAKLALAEADKAARNVVEPGRYPVVVADITELPTQYGPTNDAADIVDNPNVGGLKDGRPWAP